MKTNPNAIKTIQKNTIFTNVAETSDGGVYWEGIDQPLASGIKLISWKGQEWDPKDGKHAPHPGRPGAPAHGRVCRARRSGPLLSCCCRGALRPPQLAVLHPCQPVPHH